MQEKFNSAPAVRACGPLGERDANTHLHTAARRMWQGPGGAPPTLSGKTASHGSPAEGEALENEQSREAKESRGSIRRDKGRCGKEREDGSRRARACVVLRWVVERVQGDPRSRALEEVGGRAES